MAKIRPVNLENARIGFRNFQGKEGPYNKKGDRSFAVFLDRQTADQLAAEGWNVKMPKPQENPADPDADERDPYLSVAVAFENFPPNVYLISNGNPSRLGEEEVEMLDWAELENVDLVIRPYEWEMNGKTGVKAYLKTGYFTIVTDQFASKYGL